MRGEDMSPTRAFPTAALAGVISIQRVNDSATVSAGSSSETGKANAIR